MASAKISSFGDAVVLRLTFREAAALHALLSRVGPETNPDINEGTEATFRALDRAGDMVQERDHNLWPNDYEDFSFSAGSLVDPSDPESLDSLDSVTVAVPEDEADETICPPLLAELAEED